MVECRMYGAIKKKKRASGNLRNTKLLKMALRTEGPEPSKTNLEVYNDPVLAENTSSITNQTSKQNSRHKVKSIRG